MASPHVAGAAALHKASNPTASPLDVRNALQTKASVSSTVCDGNGHGYFDGDVDTTQEPLLYVGTPKTPTALTINAIPATGPSKLVTISGTLRDSTTNTGIAGKTITFTGTTGTTAVPSSVTTSSSGAFTTTATTVSTQGQFAAKAQFAGDTSYNTASATRTYYVDTTKPTVSITSPANGATFAPGSSITIQASAADKLLSTSPTNDGQVARVQFYYKPTTSATYTLITTDTTSPYSATISNAAAGSYTLLARAYDVAGNFQNSVTTSISVTQRNRQLLQ